MNYYKTIDDKKMDSRLLDIALKSVEGGGDGRISQKDAEKLFAAIRDGNIYTEVEKDTVAYIRSHFKWTDSANRWISDQITHWLSPNGKICMTPEEVSKEHFPIFDVVYNEEERKVRNHDLRTAMDETYQDHDEIGLIVQLASGERVEVLSSFIEISGDFVELKGGYTIPVRAIERVEI
jgi:hypothetical protein